jgi:2-(1,2-epoxy-1,2-dihydrophenyl)acetyl-CoA isomerase
MAVADGEGFEQNWPETDGIRFRADGDVLVCTIDRQPRGNSLRQEDIVALADVLEHVTRGGGPRAVLLRSEGRQFCTGADLGRGPGDGRRPDTGHLRRALAAGAHRLIIATWECAVPVVVCVQGRADGLGCHLAAAADIIVAGRSAMFSEPFVLRGFSADSGGTWLLQRRIGLTRAARMLMLGSPIGAAEAEAWGLVSELVDDHDLDRAAADRAAQLAAGATLALSLTKALVKRHAADGISLRAAMEDEAMAVELSIRADDFKEGMQAFAAKRPPEFKGT